MLVIGTGEKFLTYDLTLPQMLADTYKCPVILYAGHIHIDDFFPEGLCVGNETSH